jgi:hypothetical protein
MVELELVLPFDDDLTQYARGLAESCFAVHNNVMVAKIFYKNCQRIFGSFSVGSDGILFSNSAIKPRLSGSSTRSSCASCHHHCSHSHRLVEPFQKVSCAREMRDEIPFQRGSHELDPISKIKEILRNRS